MGVFDFGGWEVADLAVQAASVEPVDVAERRQLDFLRGASGSLLGDQFVLEQPDRGLGDGVVDRITDRTDGGCGTDLGETFGVANTGVLTGFNRW